MGRFIKTFLAIAVGLSFSANVFAQDTASLWEKLTERAYGLYKEGNYEEAIKVTEEAVVVAEKDFGPESLQVAQSLGNLGTLYNIVGRYDEAAEAHKRSREIRNKYNVGVPMDIQKELFYEMIQKK